MSSGFDLASRAGEPVLLLRLLFAALAGAAIGWNRFRAGKPAGIGTHALVALGAALFVAVPAMVSPAEGANPIARVIQGIATGVGFLGAGEIFRDPAGSRIQGLTSAAALWATAALGIIAVCGSWLIITAATAFVLIILLVAPQIEKRFPPRIEEGSR